MPGLHKNERGQVFTGLFFAARKVVNLDRHGARGLSASCLLTAKKNPATIGYDMEKP